MILDKDLVNAEKSSHSDENEPQLAETKKEDEPKNDEITTEDEAAAGKIE